MKTNKNKIAKDILIALGATGLVMIPVAGPLILLQIAKELKLGKFQKQQVVKSLYYLREKKLVGISQEGNKTVIRLTKNGQHKLLKFKLDEMVIKKPKRWDRKWRVVVFDIPEKFRLGRDYLRSKLKELGFYQMQKSAWVCPYPCEDEVDFIKELYEVRPFVRVITADSIDIRHDLVKHFGLS